MNGAHWHLLFNHLPVAGSLFSSVLLFAGYLLRNETVKNSALALFVLTGLLAIPAMLTGEGAEHVLSAINQAPDSLIETHEELAETAIFVIEITAVVALLGLLSAWKKLRFTKLLTLTCFVGMIISLTIFAKVNNTGGEIRHSEIRSGTVIPAGEEEKD